jgi:uncharacterized protein YidB (DUF937 family)
MRHYEGGRAAMNRHFFNNKGSVQYHGDFLGPSGQSYGYNSDDVKFLKQAADKDPIDPETGKKVEGWQKYAFKGISKMAIKSMENEINNSEDRFNDIADRIKNEQIPRNIIAKLIARFRGLYNKIMIKLKMGTYQREADAAYQKTANQILQDKKSGKYAKMGKFVFHTGKHTVLSYLRWVADKLLWFIDKLLQKLQNTANTAGDKIKSWLGNKSAQPQPNPA